MSHNTIPSAQPPARRNQLDVLEDIAASTATIAEGGGGGTGGPDRELLIETYRANKNFTGATTGDLITATRMIDVSGTGPTQVGATAWFNESTQLALASAPLLADIDLAGGGGGATNAELVAALATQTGTKTTASAALPAGGAGLLGWLSNIYHSFFGVSVGAADSGNPVKVGGLYVGAPASVLSGQRIDFRTTQWGSQFTSLLPSGVTAADAIANSGAVMPMNAYGSGATLPATANWLFNGTTWDRMRGSVNGMWAQGNVATGVADAGNPVKIGAIYNSAAVPVATGQRTNIQANVNGSLLVVPENGTALNDSATFAYNSNARSGGDTLFASVNMVYDGANYVRARGDVTGAHVNTLKRPLVARQLAAGAASAATQLTAAVKRVSIYARGADIRFRFANATTTAVVTDHFIAQGERLDLNCEVGATPWIAVIRDASTDGTLELSELS